MVKKTLFAATQNSSKANCNGNMHAKMLDSISVTSISGVCVLLLRNDEETNISCKT